MISVEINQKPLSDEAITLYLDAGWGTPADYTDAEAVFGKAFDHSHFITARDSQKLVGMIRFLSDEAHDTQVIECVVLKSYQRQGIGSQMLDALVQHYGTTDIYIQSTADAEAFFEKRRFKKHHLIGLSYRRSYRR